MIGFSADIERADSAALLRARGEFDLAAVELAEGQIAAAEAGKPSVIVFDLSHVTFVDSSGLRVLLGAADRARQGAHRFIAARPTGQVARLLEMTGSTALLEISPELPEPFGELAPS